MGQYRVKCTYRYSTTSSATTAVNNINAVLDNYPTVTGGPATRSSSTVNMEVLVPDQATADALRHDMISAWGVGTRSTGKFSVALVEDTLT